MRQDESNITSKNLSTHLKALHPANIIDGIRIWYEFSVHEFHGGIDPNGKNEHPLFKEAAKEWAYWSGMRHASEEAQFPDLLSSYTKLLNNFAAYLSTSGLIEACCEIARIQSALALHSAMSQVQPARAISWKEAIACAVVIGGGVLLELACSGQDAWRHFVGLLALLLVAGPVWKLARRSTQHGAVSLTVQPSR